MKIGTRLLLSAFLGLWSSIIMAKDIILTVSPGQRSFVIEVKAIPTTGFVWSVSSYDKAQFSFEGAHYLKPDDKKLIGAPLQEQFKFKLLKPLKTDKKIKLSLSRSWESKDVKPTTFIISPKKAVLAASKDAKKTDK